MTITIGRNTICDLVIPNNPANAKVSGSHATIKSMENDNGVITGFVLEDHSTNGTYVNSKLVHNGSYYIKECDIIKLGPDYVLDWKDVLPLFGIRVTMKSTSKMNNYDEMATHVSYESPNTVDHNPLPIIEETHKEAPKEDNDNKKRFEFGIDHWLITIAVFIIGIVIGTLL